MTSAATHILVIDDEPHITHVVSLKLRNAGYEVTTAGDGEEGYEAALQCNPDLIITDPQMPYLTGIELARKLKETKATAATPVIMLTARGFGLTPDDMAGTNIIDMLSKPFSPREVLEHVAKTLEGTQSSGDAKAA